MSVTSIGVEVGESNTRSRKHMEPVDVDQKVFRAVCTGRELPYSLEERYRQNVKH